MKRILHVFANLNLGGAESRVMDIYRRLPKSDCQFDFLIFTRDECYYENEVLSLGGRVLRITHPSESIIKHSKELLKICINEDYHAIHSHVSYLSGFILKIAKFSNINYRVSHARNKSLGTNSISRKLMFYIGRLLINVSATSKLAISSEAGKFLYGKNNNFDIVPNSFDFKKIEFKSFTNSNGLTDGKLRIVMVARLVEVKNHKFALEVIKKLSRNNIDLELDLIGEGACYDTIREMVDGSGLSNYVNFLGRCSDVHLRLKNYDCLILPSLSEGLGVSALEGQAAGVNCLVSDEVPEEVDLQAGLLKRLSLDVDIWVNELIKIWQGASETRSVIRKDIVEQALYKKLYDVDSSLCTFMKCYGLRND